MKIVVVSPYLFKSTAVRMLTAALKETSHEVFSIFFKELQPHNTQNPTDKEYDLFRDLIKRIKPEVVGISVRSTFFKQAKVLTQITKDVNKDILVIWGGIHPTVAPEHSLTYADAVCLGEGIYPTIELIESYSTVSRKNIEAIENIYIKTGDKIIKNPIRDLEKNIDNYPDPDWNEHNNFYIERDNIFETVPRHLIDEHSYYIMSSFGCPFSCSYCCNNALKELYRGKGRYLRRRSVNRVIGELKKTKNLFPDLKLINVTDDVFTFDKNWLSEFAKKYKDEINIPFTCYSQPSMLDKEMIEILLDAGLISVTMGIQSGSEYIRRKVFNITTYTNKDIQRVAGYFKDTGIVPCYDLLLDNPFEELKHKYESLEFFLSLPRPFDLHQHSLTLFPGVELTKRAIRQGTIKDEFIECEEQKSMFRWTAELDITRKPENLFWDILFFMSRYPGFAKSLVRRFSKSKLLYKRPKIIYPLALMQKLFYKLKNKEMSYSNLLIYLLSKFMQMIKRALKAKRGLK